MNVTPVHDLKCFLDFAPCTSEFDTPALFIANVIGV